VVVHVLYGKSVNPSQTAGKTREEKTVCPPRNRDAREGQPRDWVHQVRLQPDHLVQLLDGGAHGRVQNVSTVPQDLVPATWRRLLMREADPYKLLSFGIALANADGL
jgi:hypothetical protein